MPSCRMMLLRWRKAPGVADLVRLVFSSFLCRGTVILRAAFIFLGLMLLPAPLALLAEKRSVSFEPFGSWSSPDWREVVLNADGTGTYTDTFGTGPGRMQFDRTGECPYKGKWWESNQRSGTLVIILSPGGRTITGTWTPDPSSTIGSKTGGAILWSRK